jgi:hypothetical protein
MRSLILLAILLSGCACGERVQEWDAAARLDAAGPVAQTATAETPATTSQEPAAVLAEPGLLTDEMDADEESLSEAGVVPCGPARPGLFRKVGSDHVRFYSPPSLAGLALGVNAAAIMANSSADEHFHDYYQEHLRSQGVSDVLDASKFLGNGAITVPVLAGAALGGRFFEEETLGRGVGQWGERSLRGMLVGLPPMIILQRVTGASRPGETAEGSAWRPFQDENGVSGHSFMGAVPLITAAKMVDSPVWKTAFYAGSTLPGLSRIDDEHHYASQVLLGWWIAYLAASAVDATECKFSGLNVAAVPLGDGLGVAVEYRH